MDTLLHIGLSNAVAALVLALVVGAAALLCRRPAWRHALWLIVLLKMVTPPLVWIPVPWPATAEAPAKPAVVDPVPDPAPLEAAAPLDIAEADLVALPAADLANGLPPLEDDPPSEPPATVPAAPPDPTASPPALAWWLLGLGSVWLLGSLGWFALAIRRLLRFRGLLRHGRLAPESIQQRTRRLAQKLGLRRCPAVWLLPARVAPMLWAVGGRPRVYFPADLLDQVTPKQQDALLVHELAHLRRRDHWVRWLEFLASGLYWWHPVLYLVRRELREAEEQCCDAWVTSVLPGAGKTYATALLETLDFLSDARPAAPLLASGLGRVSDLKRRLIMIMSGTTPRALSWRGCLAVCGLGALLLPLLPALARAQVQIRTEEKEEEKTPFFIRFVTDDAEPTEADVKKLQDQLEKKQAEVRDLQKRLEALKAKAAGKKGGDGDGVKLDGVLRFELVGVDPKTGEIKKRTEVPKPVTTPDGIRVIIVPANEVPVPGAPIRVRPVEPPPAGSGGLRWIIVPGDKENANRIEGKGVIRLTPPAVVAPGAPPPAQGDSDRRIDDLEKRMKEILNELESLRRERKPAGFEIEFGPPGDKKPGPAAGDPVKSLQEQVQAIKEKEDALAALREVADAELKARAQRREGEKQAAEAELAEATAKLKLAEARKARMDQLAKQGAASEESVQEAAAQLEVARAALQRAKAELDKLQESDARFGNKVRQALSGNEAQLKLLEDRLKQAQLDLIRAKEAPQQPGKAPQP